MRSPEKTKREKLWLLRCIFIFLILKVIQDIPFYFWLHFAKLEKLHNLFAVIATNKDEKTFVKFIAKQFVAELPKHTNSSIEIILILIIISTNLRLFDRNYILAIIVSLFKPLPMFQYYFYKKTIDNSLFKLNFNYHSCISSAFFTKYLTIYDFFLCYSHNKTP